jgi:DNA (cytosine-5)-methyltransferase 1
MLRLANEFRPPIVLVENVDSGARRWVCPVRGSLEAFGYRTSALNIGVDDCGGPHRRRRVFVLAYANGNRQSQPQGSVGHESGRTHDRGQAMADANGARRPWTNIKASNRLAWPAERDGVQGASGTEPVVGPRADGIPDRVVRWPAPPGPQAAWEPPRVLGGVEGRAAKLKALGNAVSPVQAYHVGLWVREVLGL